MNWRLVLFAALGIAALVLASSAVSADECSDGIAALTSEYRANHQMDAELIAGLNAKVAALQAQQVNQTELAQTVSDASQASATLTQQMVADSYAPYRSVPAVVLSGVLMFALCMVLEAWRRTIKAAVPSSEVEALHKELAELRGDIEKTLLRGKKVVAA